MKNVEAIKTIKDAVPFIWNFLYGYIKLCEKYNLTNQQWFIDFEDSINGLSVQDHTKQRNDEWVEPTELQIDEWINLYCTCPGFHNGTILKSGNAILAWLKRKENVIPNYALQHELEHKLDTEPISLDGLSQEELKDLLTNILDYKLPK
jgi:hypothetical protein